VSQPYISKQYENLKKNHVGSWCEVNIGQMLPYVKRLAELGDVEAAAGLAKVLADAESTAYWSHFPDN
jgi:hypothetical protein